MENHNTKLDIEVATNNKDLNQPKNDLEDPHKAPQVSVGDSPRLADDFKDTPKAPSKPKDTKSPLTITSKNTTAIKKQVNMEDSLKVADYAQHYDNKKEKKGRKKNQKKRIKKHAKEDKDTKDPPTMASENIGDSHTLLPPEVLSLPEDELSSNTNDKTAE